MTSALDSATLLRAGDAECLVSDQRTLRLLLDSSDTGGALSTHRISLREGVEGAAPHRHLTTTELFYVLSGAVDLLAGEDVVHAVEGDLVVVPPGIDHAFGASADADGELLVLITPGIDRFAFFRAAHRIALGEADPSVLADPEHRFDNHTASALALQEWRSGRPVLQHPTRGEQR